MPFYEKFIKLCEMRGVSPSRVASEIGLSKSAVTKWKQHPEVSPTVDTVVQAAAYFGVPITELIPCQNLPSDAEYSEYLSVLRLRADIRRLIEAASVCSPEDVNKVIDIVKVMNG